MTMAALDFPDAPVVGDSYGSAGTLWRWDGARWASTSGVSGARGLVAYAQITANSAGFTGALVEIGGLFVTFTADPTRRYRTTAVFETSNTQANNVPVMAIRNAVGTQLARSADTMSQAGIGQKQVIEVIESGLSGSQVRKVTGQTPIGGGTTTVIAAPEYPAFIMVEDITYEAGSGGPSITPTPWTTVTLTAPWTHNTGEPVQYRMNRDVTEWRGRANASPGVNTAYFTAPVGFRPPINQPMAIAVVDGGVWTTNACYFQANGVVATLGGAHTAASFAGCSYSVTP